MNNIELQPEKVGIIGSLITEMKEQFNVLISMIPVTFQRYSESQRLFYKNVRKEGIVIYEWSTSRRILLINNHAFIKGSP